MSINHYCSQYIINMSNQNLNSSTNFPNFNPNFNLNNEDEENQSIEQESEPARTEIPKMPLFEKPLTPSDVGKLNRLVIPKQHAEKCFPLHGGGDSSEKGLLLSFEDEIGKSWRFRYSYWNSSQSYVLTKGWSRFVKEKKLDAGDIVLFLRHRADAARLFIGWRRRNSKQDNGGAPPVAAVTGGWNRMLSYSSSQHQGPSTLPYQPNAGTISHNYQTSSNGNPKRLRLFGVNLECHVDESPEPSTSDGSPMSSQGQSNYHSYPHQYNHVDISFSGGGENVLYRQG